MVKAISTFGVCLIIVYTGHCTQSALWGAAGELWQTNHPLRDFSTAGYHQSAVAPPTKPTSVNIMNYGAVGDGIADDTLALKNAIAACPSGGKVFLPAGSYQINDLIEINKSVVIAGAGTSLTTLIFTNYLVTLYPRPGTTGSGVPTSLWSWSGGYIEFNNTSEVGIEDLTFQFPETPYKGHFLENGSNGINFNGIHDGWARRLRFVNADSGIFCIYSQNITVRDIVFDAYPGRSSITGGSLGYSTGHHAIDFVTSTWCLADQIHFNVKFFHDLGIEHGELLCVYSRCSGPDLAFDHHEPDVHTNLWTDIDVGAGNFIWSNNDRGSTTSEAYWNIRSQKAIPYPPASLSNIVVGMTGPGTNVQNTNGPWVEVITPASLTPQNIFIAQLEKRIGVAQAAAALATSVGVGTVTWTAACNTNFLWSTASNWDNSTVPGGANEILFPTPIPNPGSLATSGTITLGAGETANSLTLNDAYTLTGGTLELTTGSITVPPGVVATVNSVLTNIAGLTTAGLGTLVLGGANTYTGPTTINAGGVLQANVASVANTSGAFGKNSAMNIGVTGILNLNGFNTQIGSLTGGASAITNLTLGSGTLTVGGDNTSTVFLGVIVGAGDLTKIGTGALTLGASGGNGADNSSRFTGNVAINGGTVSVLRQANITGVTSSALGNPRFPGRNVTVNNGGILSFDYNSELGRGAETPLLGIIINADGILQTTAGNRTIANLTLNGGTVSINNVNSLTFQPFGLGGNVTVGGSSPSAIVTSVGGAINLTVNVANAQRTFTVADATGNSDVDLNVSAILGNSVSSGAAAGLIKAGLGTMVLSGANIYTGATTVSAGTLLVNNTNGSGTGSGAVTVNTGGALGGNGKITGAVTIQAGGILQPGLGGGNISTLAISNTLTLSGQALFVLNRTNVQMSSKITGITKLTQGGTLSVTNAGDPLQAGDSFTLFNASSYTGGFSATNLPALSAGLFWSNSIPVNGSIAVFVAPPATPPMIGRLSILDGNLLLNGSNGLAGQQYRILTSTNLLLPRNSWTPVMTNTFDAGGGFNLTNVIPAASLQQFYILSIP